MAHEIYQLKNGKDSMAYTGLKPWHGLGQQLTPGASLAKWISEAGLDWEVLSSPLKFQTKINGKRSTVEFDGQNVLYRSDTGEPMSVVSGRYQIVQPKEIMEFFREFAEAGDMTIETAGSLNGGAKVWALARIDADFTIGGKNGNDIVEPYVLLATSCDKSIATTGQLTTVRVVCNNTLQASLGAHNKSAIKVPHSRKFDAAQVKADMGLARQQIKETANTFANMAKIGVSDESAMKFFIELLKTPKEKKTGEVDLASKRRAIPKLWNSYKTAPGSQDTVWGLVNAVTHSVDFNPHSRTDSARMNSAWFGAGAAQKAQAVELATDEKFLDSIIEKTKVNAPNQGVDRVLDMVDMG